jgi:anthranilate/para-aminobenzoate synthase component II
MSTQAERYNHGKPKFSLIDLPSLVPMVQVLEYGTIKYTRDNWKKGLKVTEIMDSMMRHQAALMSGENFDPESGLSHAGHILCNAMFLSYMLHVHPNGKAYDDRNAKEEPPF